LNLITWHSEPDVYLVTKPEGNGTNVSWTLVMKNGFFGRGMSLFMSMEKMMAPDFEHGLDMLKKAVESMPATPTAANYEVKELEWPETNFVGSKKETVKFEKMGEFFGKHLPAIATELEKMKVKPESAPVGIYWGYNMQDMSADVAAGFRLAKGIKVKGYESYSFPAAKVLQLTYYGDYQKMEGAYTAMDEFMQKKGVTKSVSIEEYVTDPMSEKDTAKWMTNIYYILK
jgi:effector-binding domain-containing protein